MGLGPNNQKSLISFLEHISYKFANFRNVKNSSSISMMESRMSANKISKYKKKSIEVKDRVRKPDAIATKSLNIFIWDLNMLKAWEELIKLQK